MRNEENCWMGRRSFIETNLKKDLLSKKDIQDVDIKMIQHFKNQLTLICLTRTRVASHPFSFPGNRR
jgi:hypothetical protein